MDRGGHYISQPRFHYFFPWHDISPMPSASKSIHFLRLAAPPGLGSNLMDVAAQSVAQIRGSNFVDPSVLWTPSHQQTPSTEIALFATVTPRQLYNDDGDNLTMRTADSRLASWAPFQLPPIPLMSLRDNR